ncbi:hypothetical protein [Halorussus pelagicus]|uniref:hypothetical protein n=1 Tax=Halorussus pelagicus TaxID=2505977 RepID=UPI000FFC3ABC|nr:hypothetical protein [Halorussus pelagicus]
MPENDSNQDMQRRNVIKSLGVAGGALAGGAGTALSVPGIASAQEKELDPSDWIVNIDVESQSEPDISTSTRPRATEIYVGPNKTADANQSAIHSRSVGGGDVSTQNLSVSASATLFTWTIPDSVPHIGGEDVTIEVSASVGLSGVSASFDICVGGSCVSIAGVDVGFGGKTIDVSTKGTFYGVPFEVTVSVTLNASIGNPLNPDPSLELGGNGEVCLGREFCDEDDGGWERVGCSLCRSAGTSVVLI